MSRNKRRPSLNVWPYRAIMNNGDGDEICALKTDFPTEEDLIAAVEKEYESLFDKAAGYGPPILDEVYEGFAWFTANGDIFWAEEIPNIDESIELAYPVWMLDLI